MLEGNFVAAGQAPARPRWVPSSSTHTHLGLQLDGEKRPGRGCLHAAGLRAIQPASTSKLGSRGGGCGSG